MARLPEATILVLAMAPIAGCDTSMPLLESWGLVDGPDRAGATEPVPSSDSTTAVLPFDGEPVGEDLVLPPVSVPEVALSPEPGSDQEPPTAANPPAPAAPVTLVSDPPLPTSLPADAARLTDPEIRTAFADMHESFTSIDMAGFMAEGAWLAETMSVTWRKDTGISGHLAGAWRVEDDRLCITYRSGYRAPETECLAVYRHPPGYLSTNPDGSLNGYHELTPR